MASAVRTFFSDSSRNGHQIHITRNGITEAQHAQKPQGGWSVNQQTGANSGHHPFVQGSGEVARRIAGGLRGGDVRDECPLLSHECPGSLLKENVEKRAFQTGTVGADMLCKNIPLFCDLLRQGKRTATSASTLLHGDGCDGWKREDLIDLFDDVIGVSPSWGRRRGSSHHDVRRQGENEVKGRRNHVGGEVKRRSTPGVLLPRAADSTDQSDETGPNGRRDRGAVQ